MDVPIILAPSASDNAHESYDIDPSKPLGKVRVVTKGLSKIKYSTVSNEIGRLENSRDLGELVDGLRRAHKNLWRLGVFKGLDTTLNRGEIEGDVDVVFKFEEKPSFYTVGANVNSKSKAGIEFRGEIPGVFGSSNTLTVSATSSGTSNNEVTGSFFVPKIPLLDKFTGLFSLFTSYNDLKRYCSYSSRSRGLKFMLSHINQRHSFVWESSIRDIFPFYNNRMKASEMVLRNSGRSLKNSLSYLYKYDTTEGDGVPTQGRLTQIKLESGLPGGDSLFFKVNYNLLYAKKLFRDLVMNLNLGCGYLHNFGPYNKTSNLLDKFNFTGPTGSHLAFRGFAFQGLGPYDHGRKRLTPGVELNKDNEWVKRVDHLGGDYYTNLQLSLYYPLKFLNSPRTLLFSFLNIGSLSSPSRSKFDAYNQISKDLRMSVGTGLTLNLSNGCWVEGFYAKPIVFAPTDSLSNFQLGLRFKYSMS